MKPLRLPYLVAVAALALSACGIVPKKQPLTLFAPEMQVAADPAWPSVSWNLQVPRPHADELLDSPRIVVRPSPGELQVYKGAVWAQPAPDLLHSMVLRDFEDSGRIAGVSRRGAGLPGDYELLLDLRRFQSSYGDGATPRVEVQVSAKLVSIRTNAVVANRVFAHDAAAQATDVASVARAFDGALSAASHDVVGWTLIEGQRYEAAHPAAKAGKD